MTATYRIAEVAKRSGFTPATLRYYEEIGLVAPTGRTPAGYRVYDDGSIERLRFIARAKQLGCTLDEVADLVAAWDGGRCSHVQARLRAAAEAKVADAHARIAELATLAADLQRALASLARSTPDGPCDETCGCYGDVPDAASEATARTAASSAASTTLTAMPIAVPLIAKPRPASAEAPEPIACTLDAAAMGDRLDEWATLLASKADLLTGVTGRTAIDGGVRLEFAPGTDVGEVARLAVAEQDCCHFFSFAVVIDGRGLALEVSAPDDAADVVTALFGAPDR